MKATDLFVKCLENEGVKYIFGIVGKESLDIVHSLTTSSITFIVVRHEQAAAFMAAVYGQLTGTPGVCTATLGPGATNLLTGIGAAYLDYAPVVAVCGQARIDRQHKISHQHLDLVQLFTPITKWSVQVKEAKTIPEIVRKAFKTAGNERVGPVYIDFPEDIAKQNVLECTPIPTSSGEHVSADRTSKETVKKLLEQAQKPFILVGKGVVSQNASKELVQFVEKVNIPAAHTFMAKGIMPIDHPLNCFTFGFSNNDYVVNMLRESDLIITIGFDIIEQLPEKWNSDKKPILHIHTTSAEVDEYYPVAYEIVSDIKKTLALFNQEELPKKEWANIEEYRERIKDSHRMKDSYGDGSELFLTNVIQALQKVLDPNTILLSDVGAHKMEIARIYQPEHPNHVLISNGFATMGIALPGAIAAKLACPNQPVVCVTGDGGFLMNVAEIETAKRVKTPLLILVLNDGMYGLEKKMMEQQVKSEEGVRFTNPDLVKLAESFGIKGYRVEHIGMLKEMIQKTLHDNDVVLLDVPVQYNNTAF